MTPKGCRCNLAVATRQPWFSGTPPPVSWSASALSAWKYEKVIVSRQHLRTALKKERGHRPLNPSSQTAAKELKVWNQIRRTEEEPMEIGTMEHALLQDHCIQTEGTVSTAAARTTQSARFADHSEQDAQHRWNGSCHRCHGLRRVGCTSSMRAAPERSLGAVSVASAPCKGFSQRDLPSTRYANNPSAHMMRQGTTLKTMDARPSATNQCHRNTTPATVRTVSTTTHPLRLNITLRTLSMTSRHRHEYFGGAAIRGDLIDCDRLGSGPRHAGQVSRHT